MEAAMMFTKFYMYTLCFFAFIACDVHNLFIKAGTELGCDICRHMHCTEPRMHDRYKNMLMIK